MTTRPRPLRLGALPALALLTAGLAACGDDGSGGPEVPGELRGWSRSEVLGHTDVAAYDRVAAGSDGRRTAWLTRARGDTGVLGMAEWRAAGDGGPELTDLTMPAGTPDELVIPAAVAVDDRGWTAVAELKDESGGRAEALAVWSGVAATPGPPATLALPDGHVLSRTVAAGRTADTAAVLALTGPAPATPGLPEPTEAVVWTAPVAADGTLDASGWQRAQPDLGAGGPLATAGVVGVGSGDAGSGAGAREARLVLAGTTADGTAGVWTSADGTSWEPLAADQPEGVNGLDLITPLGDGTALVAWATGDAGRTVDVWRLDGSDLTAAGTVTAPAGAHIDLAGAAAAGDRLVVGGSVRRRETSNPMLWASTGDGGDGGEWVASDQAELVGHLDWSVEALAADGEDAMAAVMASTPSHIDVATWTWRREP